MSRVFDVSTPSDATADDPARRGRHGWLLWWLVGAVSGIVASFIASLFIVSPWDEARANAAKALVVSAPVEERGFVPTASTGTGTLSIGATIEVFPTASDGPVVVTEHRLGIGDVATPGDAVIDVSGRPVIMLQMPFPLYRDLSPGARGEDVTALQRSLSSLGLYAGPIDGSYGPQTSAAVRSLYRAASVTPPEPSPELTAAVVEAQSALTTSEAPANSPERRAAEEAVAAARAASATPLPRSEILAVPHDRLTVAHVGAVGTVLEDGAPAATLHGGAPRVTMQVPVTDRKQFSVDTQVVVTSTDDTSVTTTGTVTAVGEFRQPSDSDPGGFEITVRVNDSTDGFVAGSAVRVTPAGAGVEQRALMIPLAALREDQSTQYVHLASTVGGETVVGPRVEIETGEQVDGYIIVMAGDLAPGQEVVVSATGTEP